MRALILALAIAACGGQPHPPAFDANGLAAELDHLVQAMADATAKDEADCPALLGDLEGILARGRGVIDRAKAAQGDPEHARELTSAMRAYGDHGRSDAIAIGLAVCFRKHPELQDRVQRLVDSIPTL